MYRPTVELVATLQHLVQLLAGSQPGVADVDGLARLRNQLTGNVVDSDGPSHVKDEGLAGPPDRTSLDYESHGLLDGHEVAGDLGVRDSDGAAGRDLGVEGSEYR